MPMAKRTNASRASSRAGTPAGRAVSPHRRDKPAAHQASIVEQDGAFYWRDIANDTLVGPFTSRQAAEADRDSPGPIDDDPLGGADLDAVLDAELEIGIEDFIDPDTGEPTHGYEPHVRDDH